MSLPLHLWTLTLKDLLNYTYRRKHGSSQAQAMLKSRQGGREEGRGGLEQYAAWDRWGSYPVSTLTAMFCIPFVHNRSVIYTILLWAEAFEWFIGVVCFLCSLWRRTAGRQWCRRPLPIKSGWTYWLGRHLRGQLRLLLLWWATVWWGAGVGLYYGAEWGPKCQTEAAAASGLAGTSTSKAERYGLYYILFVDFCWSLAFAHRPFFFFYDKQKQ